jgi:hypothetical protein
MHPHCSAQALASMSVTQLTKITPSLADMVSVRNSAECKATDIDRAFRNTLNLCLFDGLPIHVATSELCTSTAKPSTHYESRAHIFMRKAGFEPARIAPLPPQDSVSTDSTTSAVYLTRVVLIRRSQSCRRSEPR